MNDFETYLEELADHEEEKGQSSLDPRQRILVNAGIRLNWMGDFLANPKIQYKKVEVPLQKIRFTGTEPVWNEILLKQCERSVEKFQQLIKTDKDIQKKFMQEASFGREPVFMVGPNEEGFYEPFDGMHRVIGAVIENRETITAYVPTNIKEHLPVCEPHVVYDLIRAYQRHANDEQGKVELYHALKLLARTYENVIDVLQHRFDPNRLPNTEIQEIIKKVVSENRK